MGIEMAKDRYKYVGLVAEGEHIAVKVGRGIAHCHRRQSDGRLMIFRLSTKIAPEMPLEPLIAWGGGIPPQAAVMLRERLCNYHAGEDWDDIPYEKRMEHLSVIELAYSQGARPGRP